MPLGVVCFLPLAFSPANCSGCRSFRTAAVAWMAGVGVLHFVIGRYCNFRANPVAGVNLTAPVVQLQVVVTMVLAVVVLHEPCTALQMIGGALILAGSLDHAAGAGANDRRARTELTRSRPCRCSRRAISRAICSPRSPPSAYGTTPVMARFALEHTGPSTGILGGLIPMSRRRPSRRWRCFSGAVRRNVFALDREQRPLVRLFRRVRRGGAGLFLRCASRSRRSCW